MIEFHGVSARLGPREALRDVSFAAGAGELIALAGLNGAGKSTALRLAAGLLAPSSGRVLLDGENLNGMTVEVRARKAAWLQQSRPVAWNLLAEDLVALGLGPAASATFDRLSSGAQQRVDAAMARMSAAHLKGRGVLALSGGETARLHMARVLVSDAKLLLLDEPAAALDISQQLSLMDVLKQEAAAGRTVLVALHDLDLAVRFCSRIVVLHEGQVEADGVPDAVLENELLARVFGIRRTEQGALERVL
ncbi:MAG: ABC transporter ATP-binding protein [Hyphomonas sp.]|uniref:ABC transporter ATP-binding protein n=1 Tax=Hyphomonas sp. TaxID=87 RepID=UPI00352851F3